MSEISVDLLCCSAIRGHQFKAGEQPRSSVCCSSDNADIGLSTCSWSTKKFPGKALTS